MTTFAAKNNPSMIKDFSKTAIIVGEREVSYRAMLKRIELYAAQTEMAEGDRFCALYSRGTGRSRRHFQ